MSAHKKAKPLIDKSGMVVIQTTSTSTDKHSAYNFKHGRAKKHMRLRETQENSECTGESSEMRIKDMDTSDANIEPSVISAFSKNNNLVASYTNLPLPDELTKKIKDSSQYLKVSEQVSSIEAKTMTGSYRNVKNEKESNQDKSRRIRSGLAGQRNKRNRTQLKTHISAPADDLVDNSNSTLSRLGK